MFHGKIDNARILLADLYELPGNMSNNSHSGPSNSGHSSNASSPSSRAAFHRAEAALLRSAILDLFWDPEKLAFYDFNRSSDARGTVSFFSSFLPFFRFYVFELGLSINVIIHFNNCCCSQLFSAATFYPLWSGIIPHEVTANWKNAFGVFAGLNMVLNK